VKMFKMLAAALAVAAAVSLAAACTKEDKQAKDEGNRQERVLKIAAVMPSYGGPHEDYFKEQYTDVFQYANPDIQIEIIPIVSKPGEPDADGLKSLMEGDNPPDVVTFDSGQLAPLIDSNLLAQLDPLIAKEKFDTEGIVPAVVESLKDAGGGKLYGLSPTFISSALVYNKKIFTEAGVDYPRDDMTWDEVFELAKRLGRGEGDNRIDGFSFTTSRSRDLFDGLQMYVAPLETPMFNSTLDQLAVDTDQWEQVWTTMAQLQKEGVFPALASPSDMQGAYGSYDLFESGKLAMGIMDYTQVQGLISANKNAANFIPIDWDVVTLPSHPEAKGVSGRIFMPIVMGINARAQNLVDAWTYIQFMNSDGWAKLKSNSSDKLVSRMKYTKPTGQDFHIEAFYNVKPAPMEFPTGYYAALEVGRRLFRDVVQGKISVRDALKRWQTEGDAAMKQMRESGTSQAPIPLGN